MGLSRVRKRKALAHREPDAPGLDVSEEFAGGFLQVFAALDVRLERRAGHGDPLGAQAQEIQRGTAPDALPKVIIMPKRLRHSIEPSKVAFPTPSKTTGMPSPPVISCTRSTNPLPCRG